MQKHLRLSREKSYFKEITATYGVFLSSTENSKKLQKMEMSIQNKYFFAAQKKYKGTRKLNIYHFNCIFLCSRRCYRRNV